MCNLCSSDPKIRNDEHQRLERLQDNLEKLSEEIRSINLGYTKPHETESWVHIAYLSKEVIRELIEYV